MRVIDENGNALGVLSLDKALAEAQNRNLDLVEVSPLADPPVAKIVDFGKFRYSKEKAYKENQKKNRTLATKVKEIKINPQIDSNDLRVKRDRIENFLNEGKKVKVTLILRGRQRLHADRGIALVESLADELSESATVEKNYTSGISLLVTAKKIRSKS